MNEALQNVIKELYKIDDELATLDEKKASKCRKVLLEQIPILSAIAKSFIERAVRPEKEIMNDYSKWEIEQLKLVN